MIDLEHLSRKELLTEIDNFISAVEQNYPSDTWSTCYLEVSDGSKIMFDTAVFLQNMFYLYEQELVSKTDMIKHLEYRI